MSLTTKLTAVAALFIPVLVGTVMGMACNQCNSGGTCEECVARCVDTQGVSPEVCRTTACASTCNPQNQ